MHTSQFYKWQGLVRAGGAVELHWSIDKRDQKDIEKDPEVCVWVGVGWEVGRSWQYVRNRLTLK